MNVSAGCAEYVVRRPDKRGIRQFMPFVLPDAVGAISGLQIARPLLESKIFNRTMEL